MDNFQDPSIPTPPLRPCSFCGSPGNTREFIFHNETESCFVCDNCITILFNRLHNIRTHMASNTNTTKQ